MDPGTKRAVFGGGCFWCTEAIFKSLKGVSSVTPGYAGGTKEKPTYEEVCGGKTGHAEVVEIVYDPQKITYRDLLTVFFATHDPTAVNRQGADVGEQYRSIVLFTDEDQKIETENFIRELDESVPGGRPIATKVQELTAFYEAEDYHKDYFAKNKKAPYCQVIINPKLEKVQKRFAELTQK